jgi:hypothetical protein
LAGSCKQGNEPSGSIKGGEFRDQLSNSLFKNCCYGISDEKIIQMSSDFMSILQDNILEAISAQKCHKHIHGSDSQQLWRYV